MSTGALLSAAAGVLFGAQRLVDRRALASAACLWVAQQAAQNGFE